MKKLMEELTPIFSFYFSFIAIRIRGITSPTKLRIIDRVLSEFVSQALQSFIVGKVEAFVKQFIMEHLSSFSLES